MCCQLSLPGRRRSTISHSPFSTTTRWGLTSADLLGAGGLATRRSPGGRERRCRSTHRISPPRTTPQAIQPLLRTLARPVDLAQSCSPYPRVSASESPTIMMRGVLPGVRVRAGWPGRRAGPDVTRVAGSGGVGGTVVAGAVDGAGGGRGRGRAGGHRSRRGLRSRGGPGGSRVLGGRGDRPGGDGGLAAGRGEGGGEGAGTGEGDGPGDERHGRRRRARRAPTTATASGPAGPAPRSGAC